jgi:hypothetical protein
MESTAKYRQRMIIALEALTKILDDDYSDFMGFGLLPANPEMYEKSAWEAVNESIDEIVNHYIIDSLKTVCKENKADLYPVHVLAFLEMIEWDEI